MKIFAQLDENNICIAIIKATKAPNSELIERPKDAGEELGMKWNGSEFEPVTEA